MVEYIRWKASFKKNRCRMNYIVLDLEWNQSMNKNRGNKDIPFEIIEIGAIKLNQDRCVIGEFTQLVKPEIYSRMHHVTKSLLHIKMEELEDGKAFPEAMEDFRKWCGKDFMYSTWGPLDLIELQRNMKYYGLDAIANGPFPYLDAQKLFSLQYEDGKMRRTLEYAVDFLQIEKDIPFHRAFSDAYYTAKVLTKINEDILKKVSYDVSNLPTKRKDEIYVVFDNYAKYISRVFPSKQQLLADMQVSSCRCYECNKPAKKNIKWFSTNSKHYYSISYCKTHGYMKGKIRVRKTDDGMYYAIKTLKLIDEEELEFIVDKKEKDRDKHKS